MEIENRFHLERVGEHSGLVDVARDAVEHERVAGRMEATGVLAVVNELPPQLNGRLIRHKLAAAGVFDEHTRERVRSRERAEDVAAGEVEKIRNSAEDFALRAFASAGCAKEKNGAIFHGVGGLRSEFRSRRAEAGIQASLCLRMSSMISVNATVIS